jgi:hypothetical protein
MSTRKRKQAAKNFIPRAEVAQLLGVSTSRVAQMVGERIFNVDLKGRHDRETTYREIIVHLRKSADLTELRRERLTAQNRILNAEAKRTEGILVPLKEVEEAWSERILMSRALWLRMPSRLAARLAYMKDQVEVQDALEQEVNSILTELSKPIDYATDSAAGNGKLVHEQEP